MRIIEGFPQAKSALERQPLFGADDAVEQAVRQIIGDVRKRGDAALLEYTQKFDKARLVVLEVGREQIAAARQKVDAELVSALKLAADRIRSFHEAQRRQIWGEVKIDGLRQLMRPLHRVGVYVPGGTAFYPSTVLMTAIPARVAGVEEVVLATPPGANGEVPAPTLVAAEIAGVNRVFSIGGAQAIAALAFGTDTVPRVDKICGPGNIFVVMAKKLVFGAVDIDGLQGPSEILIVADDTADAEFCAADILAQAEHDSLASAIMVTTSKRLAEEVNRAVEEQLKSLGRKAIAEQSLNSRGLLAVVGTIDEAIELANLYAPEHLYLLVERADFWLDKIRNAGCIFTGENSTVAMGDYVAGPSHALPTGGTARFGSPLNVLDFIKLTSVIDIDKDRLKKLGPAARIMARAEGLEAHAWAVEKRMKRDNG